MTQKLRSAWVWAGRRAENIAALMVGAMFVAFIIQIVFRYVANLPIGWTHEISVIIWVWLVLFGASFVVREREEIRFDIFYGSATPNARRVMVIISAIGLIVAYTVSLPAVVEYISFMKVEKTAYLKIRFDWLFSIYAVFAVASIIRYIWIGWQAMRGPAPDAFDPTTASSGV